MIAALAYLVLVSHASRVDYYESPYTNGWSKSAFSVPSSGEIMFTIAIREQGIDEIKRIALDVSDPASASYGKFLTQEQLDKISAPKEADVIAVTSWLDIEGVHWNLRTVSNVEVTTSIETASKLLSTRFHRITNRKTGQSIVRAADYSLPSYIHEATAAIFGLHGLPLPPTKPLVIRSTQRGPIAKVTPEVLASTYNISGVNTTRSVKNRQAVVEFQGQLMSSKDLTTFFKAYVNDYKVGTDDVVYKYQGAVHKEGTGVEAELDIQYIMGTAVGLKTEFWEFPANDFCHDLNQWTSSLASSADVPLVHSVSYGWQGNISQIHCKDDDLSVVDNNFAKLAAKGLSIMIASGDSGSGYPDPSTPCVDNPFGGGSPGTALIGDIHRTVKADQPVECCLARGHSYADGWTFVPHSSVSGGKETAPALAPFKYSFNNAAYHTLALVHDGPFKSHDVQHLNGDLDDTGGTIIAKSDNHTFPDTSITFGKPKVMHTRAGTEYFFNISASFEGKTWPGQAYVLVPPGGQAARAGNVRWMNADHPEIEQADWERGGNPPPPPPPGTCIIYSTVTGTTRAHSTTISGGSITPEHVQLWPSWPASSPWVTAVGATRFVRQEVGNEEMATDQFGSGGGFSVQFQQEPHAKWQESAVASYLSTVNASTLPPAGSFPPKGRATPDVSALGEGYQVIVAGRTGSVGGTSASCPAFAAMVSLLNEARLDAGKPAMGFLNPFLYANPDAFTDITKGSNKIGRGGSPLRYGFDCAEGWDPATGLGTPKFDKLLAAAMSASELN